MTMKETDTQIRLRRAKEALEAARVKENEWRVALASAVRDSARAKERYEELFRQEEREEVQRRQREYRHTTN